MLGSSDKTARLWEVPTGRELVVFAGHFDEIISVAFSLDGNSILTGSGSLDAEGNLRERGDYTARLWDTKTGKEIQRFTGPLSPVMSVGFSPDGLSVFTGGFDGTARLWDRVTGREIRQFTGHSDIVRSVSFSPDGRFILTASYDSTARLWDASTGKELCRLISFREGNWVVVDPEGRFDTNNLEEIKGLHWIMPDDPMKPLPLEIFMRDYYEPRLMPRILAGQQFKPIRSLTELNRVQPSVRITGIEQQKDRPDLAIVTVEASSASREFKPGNPLTRQSGVFDIRLFRDGHIVAQFPQVKTKRVAALATHSEEQRLKQWQEEARVKPGEQVKQEASGSYTITFKDIRLPQRTGLPEVEFSAYAFNEDRVKSETFKKSHTLPKTLTPHKGKAYILTVGVNRFDNRAWDLRYAANDAREVQRLLVEKVRQTAEYQGVIGMSLVSDGEKQKEEEQATKANIKAAVEDISKQARPEDLVIIYYSSHGYADRRGQFYLFPTDIGEGSEKEISAAVLDLCISSEELTDWMTGMDAGEMVMVIDACQSAGTVKGEEGGEFKPGPMGSRGLGQLAYDKGMKILAASQADDFAFELDELQDGLLTYALIRDGIEGRKADKNKDGQITLSESLSYSLDRVPVLYEAMRKNELGKLFRAEGSRGPVVTGQAASVKKKNSFQKPSLFNFTKKGREVVLVGRPVRTPARKSACE